MTTEPFPCFQHWGSALWAHYHTNKFTVWCNVLSFLSCKDIRIWVYSSGLCMSQIIASQFDIVSHLTLQTTEKFQASRFVCGSFIVQPQCSLCEGGINSQIIAQKQIVTCWKHCFAEPLCPASTRKKKKKHPKTIVITSRLELSKQY